MTATDDNSPSTSEVYLFVYFSSRLPPLRLTVTGPSNPSCSGCFAVQCRIWRKAKPASTWNSTTATLSAKARRVWVPLPYRASSKNFAQQYNDVLRYLKFNLTSDQVDQQHRLLCQTTCELVTVYDKESLLRSRSTLQNQYFDAFSATFSVVERFNVIMS